MDAGALIGDMIRAGVDPALIERTVDALIEMARTSAVQVVKDESAERRRIADRERKAQAKEFRRIPQNSAESDEEIPSLPLSPPSQTLPPTLPHTPVREAKPSVPATPPPEGTVSAYSKPKPPRPPSTADPRHAEFVRIFADEYAEATGQLYAMAGGKDGQQLHSLLKTLKDLTADEWREGIRWSWKIASQDQFAAPCVRQTGSLAAFCSAWSRLVAYHATYQQPRR